jgi:hypothetical protein
MYSLTILISSVLFLFCLPVSCTDTSSEERLEGVVVVDKKADLPSVQYVDSPIVDTMDIDTTPKAQKVERPSRKPAKIQFDVIVYNYDTIQQGDVVEYSFLFKNVGERLLSISDVQGSCGCTIGSYPFLDIAPNEENTIKVRFDSKNKKGAQTTTVTVYTNAEPKDYVLTLQGFVKE